MIYYTTTIKKFGVQGEKTGWMYIEVPAAVAQQLKPGNKKSFTVKGKIDNHAIKQVSLLPVGEGNFIIPLNAAIRKGVRKNVGAEIQMRLAPDTTPFEINKALLDCLKDEPAAVETFEKLPPSHQKYFSKWIDSAKTETTKAKRIALSVTALSYGKGYAAMLQSLKAEKR